MLHTRQMLLALALVACSPASRPPRAHVAAAPCAATPLEALYDAHGVARVEPEATTLEAPVDRWEVRTLAPAVEPRAPRPRRVGKRDIRLHGARLDDAFRLIADVGGFNLVVKGDFAEPVSLALRAVEPYDALLAIAEANGAEVRWQGNIAVVAPAREPAVAAQP